MSSTRLPGKVLLNVGTRSLLNQIINRLKASVELDSIIVATSTNKADDEIFEWCEDNGINVFRGKEDDVLERYYQCAKAFELDIIVRITSDDPFKDPEIIDQLIKKMRSGKFDFVCNNRPVSFPEGLDVEIMTKELLIEVRANASSQFEKEHVTQYIHKRWENYKTFNLKYKRNLAALRWTIDTKEDYLFANKIYEALEGKGIFLMSDILRLLESHPELQLINKDVGRSTLYTN